MSFLRLQFSQLPSPLSLTIERWEGRNLFHAWQGWGCRVLGEEEWVRIDKVELTSYSVVFKEQKAL